MTNLKSCNSAILASCALALTACATAPTKPEAPLTPYVCDGAVNNLNADYYTSGKARVVLNLEGEAKTLYLMDSANGQRYTNGRKPSSSAIPNPGKPGTLIWWSKGSDAILYQIATRADGFRYEQQLATCTSNPQPLPAPSLAPMPVPTGTQLPGTIPGTAPTYTTQPVTI